MKKVEVSARTMSGLIGLAACYSVSVYFFWQSQFSWEFWGLDPRHSLFTKKVLYLLIGREYAKPVGVICAFLSIHASWAWRYAAGDFIERLWHRFGPSKALINTKSNTRQTDESAQNDQQEIKDVAALEEPVEQVTFLPAAKHDKTRGE